MTQTPQPHWFQQQLLAWHDQHGRKDLPWQQDPTPYRVWVSEIMLQQTQVNTVIPYYQRFMARFPDLATLAAASIDEVLHLWSGLGYYARGRNLHRAAHDIINENQGIFPDTLDALITLPGIGRSTAAAILALSRQQHHAILDGNVKRVLARYAAIEGWPGKTAVQNQLWQLAEHYTPGKRVATYTQAIMDLGATICTRSRPDCGLCPVAKHCQAHTQQRVREFPYPKPRKTLPVRQTRMLMLSNEAGHILLQQRPPTGIWGGLWSLPEYPDGPDTDMGCWAQQFGGTITGTGTAIRHSFSHFHLEITPVMARFNPTNRVMDGVQWLWYNPDRPESLGLAAPIKKLLNRINISTTINEEVLE